MLRTIRTTASVVSLTVVGIQAGLGWYRLGRKFVQYRKDRNND